MKVKIQFTVDISSEAWTENYGAMTTAELREDVRFYAEDVVLNQMRSVNVLKSCLDDDDDDDDYFSVWREAQNI